MEFKENESQDDEEEMVCMNALHIDPIEEELEEKETMNMLSESEDEIIYESKVLLTAMKEGRELPTPKKIKQTNNKALTKIKKIK